MPAKQLRCEVWVIPEGDRTGERAIECRAIALSCVGCGDSAGCVEHALMCPQCKGAICDSCEYRCVTDNKNRAGDQKPRGCLKYAAKPKQRTSPEIHLNVPALPIRTHAGEVVRIVVLEKAPNFATRNLPTGELEMAQILCEDGEHFLST